MCKNVNRALHLIVPFGKCPGNRQATNDNRFSKANVSAAMPVITYMIPIIEVNEPSCIGLDSITTEDLMSSLGMLVFG